MRCRVDVGLIHTGVCHKRHIRSIDTRAHSKLSDAPRTVSAHRRGRSIGIHIHHPKIYVRRFAFRCGVVQADVVWSGFESKQPICTHAKLSPTHLAGNVRQLLPGEVQKPVVDDDKVVSSALHFGKFNNQVSRHTHSGEIYE